jgi:peptidoglycan/LPS O-acetylase OafA/YrhL
MSGGEAVGQGQGVRGRRKSARVAGAVALLLVAAALVAAALATGAAALLWVAVGCGVLTALMLVSGRIARKSAPPHADHPHLDHPEDHP